MEAGKNVNLFIVQAIALLHDTIDSKVIYYYYYFFFNSNFFFF